MTKCFYHSRDLDGFTSGAVVKHKFPEIELIGWDYGDPVPYNHFKEGEEIILIDISFPPEDMKKISEMGKKVVWIDHHKSAIEDSETHGYSHIAGLREVGLAACELAWEHLFPKEEMPSAILILGEYDTWRNEDQARWDNIILPFQYGMRIQCGGPEEFDPILLDRGAKSTQKIEDIIWDGKTILDYQGKENEKQCKKAAFEMDFMGLRAICLNGGGFNSQVFASVYDPERHDIMMPFQFDGKKWTVSMYSDKDEVDCSDLAKQQGGGGHKGAAGFTCKRLPFKLPL